MHAPFTCPPCGWVDSDREKYRLGVGLSATCGTSECYGANHGILGIDELKTVEVEIADLDGLSKTEVVDIDNHTLGNLGVDSLDLELLHRKVELTTGLYTLGVALELHGNLDGDGLAVGYFEKIHVKDVVLYGMELDLLENCHTLLTVDIKLYGEDVGGIDKLAHILALYNKVGCDKTLGLFSVDFNDLLAGLESAGERKVDNVSAVKNNGDEVLLAEVLGCLLAQIGAGLGCQLKCFHFGVLVKLLCYSKLSLSLLISHHTGC